mmetsp:Transcript_52262/g.117410  ORF Transcript_52262/g.117410 Transcript_52262/m.117410 type:complete len:213 (+) Transcript_52262:305-943(+)
MCQAVASEAVVRAAPLPRRTSRKQRHSRRRSAPRCSSCARASRRTSAHKRHSRPRSTPSRVGGGETITRPLQTRQCTCDSTSKELRHQDRSLRRNRRRCQSPRRDSKTLLHGTCRPPSAMAGDGGRGGRQARQAAEPPSLGLYLAVDCGQHRGRPILQPVPVCRALHLRGIATDRQLRDCGGRDLVRLPAIHACICTSQGVERRGGRRTAWR